MAYHLLENQAKKQLILDQIVFLVYHNNSKLDQPLWCGQWTARLG
jgi:hypothetical protein